MKIVLVNAGSEMGLAVQLSEYGHDIRAARSAADVLSMAVPFEPDVIWIKEPLPDGTAEELAALLRSDEQHDGVTIVKHSETPWDEDGHGRSHVDLSITQQSFVAVLRKLT